MALSSRPYSEKMVQIITALALRAKDQLDHFLLKDPRLNWEESQEFNVLIILFPPINPFARLKLQSFPGLGKLA